MSKFRYHCNLNVNHYINKWFLESIKILESIKSKENLNFILLKSDYY